MGGRFLTVFGGTERGGGGRQDANVAKECSGPTCGPYFVAKKKAWMLVGVEAWWPGVIHFVEVLRC